ncbi:MAG: Stp1/IreP family PP2C-type Ser/Thr phosphatase [Pseudomonadota bacterium]
MKFDVRAKTHTGLVRKENEDCHLVLDGQGLLAVADGMGGHAHGEVASALAIQTLESFFALGDDRVHIEETFQTSKARGDPAADVVFERFLLRTAIESANLAIYEKAKADEALRSMGTTIVALYVINGCAWVANVGDSRLYRFRDGALTQLTEDHSLVNEYLKLNLLTGDQARAFPMKNIIVRALGLAEWVEVDTFEIDVASGDQYLLCSDGLSDLVPEERINEIMGGDDPDEVIEDLVQAALDAGGLDNITVLLARLEE